jgi:peptide/nickel transport system substrate-binding protein
MMKNKGPFAKLGLGVLVAAAVAALALAGCGGGGDGAGTGGGGEATAAKPGGTIKVAAMSEAGSLNPFLAIELTDVQVTRQINESLYRQDESGEFVPQLATSYETSPDGLTWTFQLRNGVKFSDGKPLTADDVRFSIEKAKSGPYSEGLFEEIERVSAPSSTSVAVKTKKPMAALLADLSSHYAPIVPANFGGVSEKEFGQHPIGTGPFILKDWAHGSSISLVRNPNYWHSGQPLADELTYEITPNDNSRITQFQGGAFDVIEKPTWSQVKSLEQAPGVKVTNFGLTGVDIISLNLNKPLFANPKVREAVSLALDREGIIKAALAGYGEPAVSFMPPTTKYYDKSLKAPEQNLEKAKQLVAAAEKEGVQPSFTLNTIAGEAYGGVASQIIQQNLTEAGFQVKLQPLDSAAMVEKWLGGETDADLGGYFAGIPDPSELASFYPEVIAKPNGMDIKGLEALAAEAATELDPAKRETLYAEMQEAVAKEQQIVTIDYQANIWVTQAGLSGLEVNSTNNPWFAGAGFSE